MYSFFYMSLSLLCRQYIAHAKQFQPALPNTLVDYITGAYVSLRNSDLLGKDFYTTPRTLTAIIRMSQALARLRFANEVAQPDIDEAMRLMDASRASVLTPQKIAPHSSAADPATRIYSLIKDFASELAGDQRTLDMDSLKERIRLAGLSEQQLMDTIRTFESAAIWHLSPDERRLVLLN
jgi:DNA replication licensing factor MCM7